MRREDQFSSLDNLHRSGFLEKYQQRSPNKAQVFQSPKFMEEIYKSARERLSDVDIEAVEAAFPQGFHAKELTRDVFQMLYASHVVPTPDDELQPGIRETNKHLLDQAAKLPEYPVLRSYCQGKPDLSMTAAAEVVQRLAPEAGKMQAAANGGRDRLDLLDQITQRECDTFRELLEAQQHIERAEDDNADSEAEIADYLQAATRLRSLSLQSDYLRGRIQIDLIQSGGSGQIIQEAVASASEKVAEIAAIMQAWGDETREMEVDPELIRQIKADSFLLEIASYLGRFKEMFRKKRRNGFAYGRGEKYSIIRGNKLSALLSSEYGLLALPALHPLFLRKYQQKALKQYQRREKICKGSGDIIACVDESSSMHEGDGQNAVWAKAVALALLEVAKTEGRKFALIHFSSSDECVSRLFLPGKYTPEDVLDAAKHDFYGCTDFEPPLREAIRIIEEDGFQNADIAFFTDGEDLVSKEFLQKVKSKQTELGFSIAGVLIDEDGDAIDFSLKQFCNEIYHTRDFGKEKIAESILSNRAA